LTRSDITIQTPTEIIRTMTWQQMNKEARKS